MTKLNFTKNTLMTSKTAGLSIALFAVASMMFPINSSYALDFETDVSIWDSHISGTCLGGNPDTFDPPNGLYGIGGCGQISGDFAVDTFLEEDIGIQVGLRAQERLVGLLPTIDNVYFAEVSASPGLATWNFDWSLDFGTTYLEDQLSTDLTPKNMQDFDVILSVDNDSSETTDFVDFDLVFFNDLQSKDLVVLDQESTNLGFFDGVFGITFDPTVPGIYDFVLTVSDIDGVVASTNIQVRVGDTGCSPGFWKTHTDGEKFPNAWSQTGFSPDDDFDEVFMLVDGTTGDLTLIDALESKGGKENQLYRFAVATLLNAAHPTIDAEEDFDEVSEIKAIVSVVDFEDRTSIRAAVALLAPQTDLIGCPITGEEPIEV